MKRKFHTLHDFQKSFLRPSGEVSQFAAVSDECENNRNTRKMIPIYYDVFAFVPFASFVTMKGELNSTNSVQTTQNLYISYNKSIIFIQAS